MQTSLSKPEGGALTDRTLPEILVSIRAHARSAAMEVLEIGRDLQDAKAKCTHGDWLPFLNDVGISARTAENYMRLSAEISPSSPLAALPYSKALALLALPAEEREAFAQEHQDKTAKALRDLINEKNQLAEEKLMVEHQLRDARTQAETDRKAAAALRNQLDELISHPATVEVEKRVEVPPADYERLKAMAREYDQDIEQAAQAAIAAEDKARKLEDEVRRLKEGGMDPNQDPEEYAIDTFSAAVTAFLTSLRNYPQRFPAYMIGNFRKLYETDLNSIEAWCRDMRKIFAMADETADAEAVIT